MADNVLKVEHVTMQFGGVVAVNDLSMEVTDDRESPPGENEEKLSGGGSGRISRKDR